MRNLEDHPLLPDNRVPIFISAGVFKEPAQLEYFEGVIDPSIVPTITLGGFSYHSRRDNTHEDFFYNSERGLAQNIRRFPNPGKDGLLKMKDSIKRLTDKSIRTIVQVVYLPDENPVEILPLMTEIASEVEPTVIEVNLSCRNNLDSNGIPHEPICNAPKLSGEIMGLCRDRVGPEVSLSVKDSSHAVSPCEIDEEQLQEFLTEIRLSVDGITGINTVEPRLFENDGAIEERGGVSGPIIVSLARKHLQICRQVAPELAYLSVGGVDRSNAHTEIPYRLTNGAVLVGGAQEFYRASNPQELAIDWAIAAA